LAQAIRIRSEVLSAIVDHARRDAPHECCGLLAGGGGVVAHAYPARNAAAAPAIAYDVAPRELFEFMRQMRAEHLDFLGIYHSHPSTENRPSPTDIECAYYPDVAYFILSPAGDAARPVRVFSIRDGRVEELTIEVV
jgi:[CysO sulfur-carrier protein]-S-L-cysteine hydrolase